ncbi:MAG: hypothetical protein OXG49_11915 [Chloroflexi bacterium]|nr:hypothetical protein [Chloroflexota bacterium]
MARLMSAILTAALLGAIIGAIAGLVTSEFSLEGALSGGIIGAIIGGLLGGSIGMLIAARRRYGASTPSYEFETAGIHDGNLITIARRNLARGAYRDSAIPRIMEEKIEGLANANRPKRN